MAPTTTIISAESNRPLSPAKRENEMRNNTLLRSEFTHWKHNTR